MSSDWMIPLISGSVAGLLEHAIVFPIDTIKTRLQSSRTHANLSFSQVYDSLIRPYGGCLAHGAHFLVYETTQHSLRNRLADSSWFKPIYGTLLSSCVAAAVHDLISTPFDVIKQHCQIANYPSIRSAFRGILANHGPAAFFLSYPTTLLLNIPTVAGWWVAYEASAATLRSVAGISVSETPSWPYFLAGGFAGTVSAFLSNPIDVVRTRIQLLEIDSVCTGGPGLSEKIYPTSNPYRIQFNPFSIIYRALKDLFVKEGPTAIFRGVSARALQSATAGAISMVGYETTRNFLHKISGRPRPSRSPGSFHSSE